MPRAWVVSAAAAFAATTLLTSATITNSKAAAKFSLDFASGGQVAYISRTLGYVGLSTLAFLKNAGCLGDPTARRAAFHQRLENLFKSSKKWTFVCAYGGPHLSSWPSRRTGECRELGM
jgi:hypothetical protein